MKQGSAIKRPLAGNRLIRYVSMLLFVIVPGVVFSQPPPPNGGNLPDTPLGVPFDSNMNLLLLFVGIMFAVVVLKRLQKNKNAVKALVN